MLPTLPSLVYFGLTRLEPHSSVGQNLSFTHGPSIVTRVASRVCDACVGGGSEANVGEKSRSSTAGARVRQVPDVAEVQHG